MTPTRSMKTTWAVVATLAAAVVALGGVLLHQQGGNATPEAAPSVRALPPVPDLPPVQAAAPVQPPEVVAPVPPPPQRAAQPAPPVAAVCKVCGHVESVHPVQHQAPTTGVGAVAGGVLGGVLGNQVGHGNGRTAATVIGAVGGGFAGNAVEKHTHTTTTYDVRVRMQDGSLRSAETQTAPPIGKEVRFDGKQLRPADGQK